MPKATGTPSCSGWPSWTQWRELDALAEVDALGEDEAPNLVAPAAWPDPLLDEVVGLGEVVDGLGEVEPVVDGLGEVDEPTVGLAAFGPAARHWVEMPEHSSTWRNRSSAVCPTMLATFSAPWPGTDTVRN